MEKCDEKDSEKSDEESVTAMLEQLKVSSSGTQHYSKEKFRELLEALDSKIRENMKLRAEIIEKRKEEESFGVADEKGEDEGSGVKEALKSAYKEQKLKEQALKTLHKERKLKEEALKCASEERKQKEEALKTAAREKTMKEEAAKEARQEKHMREEVQRIFCKHLVQKDTNVEFSSKVLHSAVASGNAELVAVLLEAGLDIESRVNQTTPLLTASAVGSVSAVKGLLERGADLKACDGDSNTALHHAASSGSVEVVTCLLDLELPVDCRNNTQETPLLVAAKRGKLTGVQLLSSRGGDVKASDGNGNNALHFAAWFGYVDLVGYLLTAGIHVDCRNSLQKTPLLLAAERGKFVSVELLSSRGGDLRACDKDNNTALHFAAFFGYTKMVSSLLDLGIPVDSRNTVQKTPLLVACETGRLRTVQLLSTRGGDLKACDMDNNGALHFAAWSGDVELIGYLLDFSVPVDVRNNIKLTPLLFAAASGKLDAVQLLLSRGSDVSAVDNRGGNALYWAQQSGNEDVSTYLKDLVEESSGRYRIWDYIPFFRR